jgi:group I intron endonuclease
MNTGIYKWTSPSGKFYIGLATDLKRRHREFTTNPNNYIYTSIDSAIDKARRKYPDFSKWRYEILEYCSREELKDLEVYYIEKFKATDSKVGYNSTAGGDGCLGLKWTNKHYEALKKRRSYVGENNPNFGKKHTLEAKDKMSQSRLGKPLKEDVRLAKCKAIEQHDRNGNLIKIWESATKASKILDIDKSLISKVCVGKKKSAGGYIWKFAKD